MCGIAGHIALSGTASSMDLRRLRHRGPDASGEWWSEDRRVWLGHTRLSILDLSELGAQPMVDPHTGNVVVYNGEVYNHLQLREELARAGAVFAGTSDTETILAGFRIWGIEVFSRLSGMFALAIHCPATRRTFLARGRFGIKPLYWRYTPGERLEFCSEVRPLSQTAPCRANRRSVAHLLQRGCSPHGRLLFPEIQEVPAGSWMEVGERGPLPARLFWPPARFAEPREVGGGRAAVVRGLRERLERSVEAHLLSDVPVAAFLSGGIDSSAIVALASERLKRDLHTFSVGFPDPRLDESPFAREVAERFGTTHHHIVLDEKAVIEQIREAVEAMDLPSIDAVNTYIVSRAVANAGFKVALSGLGGDELFGGYQFFREIPRLKWLALFPEWVRSIPRLVGRGRHALGDVPARPDPVAFTIWRRRMLPGDLLRMNGMVAPPFPSEPSPELVDDFAAISWSELSHYMRDMLLRDTDQMSMAHSLEVRVPFLESELVDYTLGLPSALKTAAPPGFEGVPKPLLVESVADLLPASVYRRAKQGFQLPMEAWIRGPLNGFWMEGVENARERGALTPEFADMLVGQFQAGFLRWEYAWLPSVLGHYLKRHRISCDADGADLF